MAKKSGLVFITFFMIAIVAGVSTLSIASTTTSTAQYVYLTINIYGNGNLTVNYQTINKTTTFKVLAGNQVILTSNQPFWLGNGTLITTAFWGWVMQNTTLNVYFNVSGVTYPPSEYTRVTIVDEGKLNLTVSIGRLIFNGTYFLTQFYIDNSSATFYVPIKSTVFIFYGSNFYVNGSPASEWSSDSYVYQYIVNTSTPVLVATTTKNATTTTTSTTTSTLPRTTVISLPTPNTTVTITPHSGTVIPTSTSSSNSQLAVYAIIAVIVIVLVAFFVIRRVRK